MKLLLGSLFALATFGQCMLLRDTLVDVGVSPNAATMCAILAPVVGAIGTYAYFTLQLRRKQRS